MKKKLDKYTAKDLLRAYQPNLLHLKRPEEKISQLEIWAIDEIRSIEKEIGEMEGRLRAGLYTQNSKAVVRSRLDGRQRYLENLKQIGLALGFHPEPTWCAVRDRLALSLNASRKNIKV